MHLTDGQTDGRTELRQQYCALHYMPHGNQISLTYFTGYNRLPKKVGVNRHFQASCASQFM